MFKSSCLSSKDDRLELGLQSSCTFPSLHSEPSLLTSCEVRLRILPAWLGMYNSDQKSCPNNFVPCRRAKSSAVESLTLRLSPNQARVWAVQRARPSRRNRRAAPCPTRKPLPRNIHRIQKVHGIIDLASLLAENCFQELVFSRRIFQVYNKIVGTSALHACAGSIPDEESGQLIKAGPAAAQDEADSKEKSRSRKARARRLSYVDHTEDSQGSTPGQSSARQSGENLHEVLFTCLPLLVPACKYATN